MNVQMSVCVCAYIHSYTCACVYVCMCFVRLWCDVPVVSYVSSHDECAFFVIFVVISLFARVHCCCADYVDVCARI